MTDFKQLIAKVGDSIPLSQSESEEAFSIMMGGEATPSQIGGFLMALRVRGETVDEITGAVQSMRSRMLRVDAPENAMDIVGTGGDASGSYNISTCTAMVVAGCGVPIAKHGNRALSSKSGAADTLKALGINLELDPAGITRCIDEAGLGFMFAPAHHAAMRHVGPTRVELGTRTIFNLLGPLSNPASVTRQLVGVFDAKWVRPLADVLQQLGSKSVWVVHGDGLDEMTVTGETLVAELKDGEIREFSVTPQDAGLETHSFEDLKGGDAKYNAAALRDVLNGAKNAYRDIVLLNAAASLIVAEKVNNLKEGAKLAANSIDSGAAKTVLEKLVLTSNDGTPQ